MQYHFERPLVIIFQDILIYTSITNSELSTTIIKSCVMNRSQLNIVPVFFISGNVKHETGVLPDDNLKRKRCGNHS